MDKCYASAGYSVSCRRIPTLDFLRVSTTCLGSRASATLSESLSNSVYTKNQVASVTALLRQLGEIDGHLSLGPFVRMPSSESRSSVVTVPHCRTTSAGGTRRFVVLKLTLE